MKLSLRANQLSKKLTLLSTAFVLAVSTLTASVPFILSSSASAAAVSCEDTFKLSVQKCVDSVEALELALDNTAIQHIILSKSIETTKTIIVDRPVTLNGWDKTITFVGDSKVAGDWKSNYVVQVWNTKGVTINSLRVTGGDAGLYVNGSEVRMTGHNHVSGNQFGGIQVSGGASPLYQSKLTYAAASNGNRMNFVNTTESASNPTIWTDSRNNEVANLTGVERVCIRGLNSLAPWYQDYYFLSPQIANVVATNTTVLPNAGYSSVEAATDAASAGDVIRLDQNVELTSPTIRIRNAVTIEGNGKTVTTTQNRGAGGVNNAAFVVISNNVKIQNLTTVGIGGGSAAHGIVVNTGVTGAVIENVTLMNGAAGIIVNGSQATVKNIKTVNNNWYGINVDKGGVLTVEGVNEHDSNVYAIYSENAETSTVHNNGQYARISNPVDNKSLTTDVAYVLKSAAPVASVAINGSDANVVANDKTATITVQGNAAGPNDPKYHYFMITAPGKTELVVHIITSTSRDVSFNLRDVPGVPLEGSAGKMRVKAGAYNIRYVVFDSNNIRNDAVASESINLTVDNASPSATVELSNDYVVSNNALPTVTVNATDAATGVSTVEYKIVAAQNPELTVVGWTDLQNGTATTLDSIAGLPNGSYAVAVAVLDGAGNRYRHESIVFTINRDITATFSVSSLQTATPNLNGTAHYANGVAVANETLSVTVDGVAYPTVTTSANGVWNLPLTGVTNGDHAVTVALNGVGVIIDTVFKTTLPLSVVNVVTQTPPAQETLSTSSGARTPVPGFVSPAAIAGILGDSTEASDNADDDQAVEGMSTFEKAAQAVDADNTDGTAMGLAWYWWVLIAAGLALLGWWIAAAIRRRQAE